MNAAGSRGGLAPCALFIIETFVLISATKKPGCLVVPEEKHIEEISPRAGKKRTHKIGIKSALKRLYFYVP